MPIRTKAEWWRLAVPADDLPKGFRLALTMFLLSDSSSGAWSSITRALWHSMALEPEVSCVYYACAARLPAAERGVALKPEAVVRALLWQHGLGLG